MPGGARPLVRLWEPPEYAVVLGASCRLADDVFLEDCRADGVPILRRSSGGGTVVVGPGVLCVTVILPEDAAPGLSRVDLAHDHVLERIAAAIRGAGRSRQRARPRRPGPATAENSAAAPSAGSRTGSWCTARSSTISRSSGSSDTSKCRAASPNIAPADPTKTFWSTCRCNQSRARGYNPERIFCPGDDRCSRRFLSPPALLESLLLREIPESGVDRAVLNRSEL